MDKTISCRVLQKKNLKTIRYNYHLKKLWASFDLVLALLTVINVAAELE